MKNKIKVFYSKLKEKLLKLKEWLKKHIKPLKFIFVVFSIITIVTCLPRCNNSLTAEARSQTIAGSFLYLPSTTVALTTAPNDYGVEGAIPSFFLTLGENGCPNAIYTDIDGANNFQRVDFIVNEDGFLYADSVPISWRFLADGNLITSNIGNSAYVIASNTNWTDFFTLWTGTCYIYNSQNGNYISYIFYNSSGTLKAFINIYLNEIAYITNPVNDVSFSFTPVYFDAPSESVDSIYSAGYDLGYSAGYKNGVDYGYYEGVGSQYVDKSPWGIIVECVNSFLNTEIFEGVSMSVLLYIGLGLFALVLLVKIIG